MTQARARPPVLGAAVATALSLVILIALGVWQLQRLHWKQDLIARIDSAETAPPVALAGTTPPLFARVRAQGTLRGDHMGLYGAEVRGMHMGAQSIQVLDRQGEKSVLVMLGWVSTDGGAPRPQSGPADITGYVRLPEPSGWLSASDDLEGRHFYALNPTTIGASLGVADVSPFVLVALGPQTRFDRPQPAEALPRPTNNHFQYALTWFGLAASLAGVFLAWAFRRT